MTKRVISLTEFRPTILPAQDLSYEEGEMLWRQSGEKVRVEFPSPTTQKKWRLTSRGWVGFLPVTNDLCLRMSPRTPLGNLFRMLEYAYHLRSFEIDREQLIDCASLDAVYERLASILAKRVLDRARKGLYRTYVPHNDRLPFVRGRISVEDASRASWSVNLQCQFEEHTADVEDNQILAWTLWQIARTGMCSEGVLLTVRKASRALQGRVTRKRLFPENCIGRLYHRLNQDYQLLHALCRFFLEQSCPSHETGEHGMLPFLVNMARLYELFVAEWLKKNPRVVCKSQKRVSIGKGGLLDFNIDLVLYEAGQPKYVLDTKYKIDKKPSHADLYQIVTYAKLMDCREAILVYPHQLNQPMDLYLGDTRVRTLSFSIDGDLDQAGEKFLDDVEKPSYSG